MSISMTNIYIQKCFDPDQDQQIFENLGPILSLTFWLRISEYSSKQFD